MNTWLFVGILALIHICFINVFEKLLVQLCLGSLHRPCASCRDRDTFECLGMPSGHAESIVVVVAVLAVRGVISVPVGIVIISLVCMQRIMAYRHTLNQVLVGAGLGASYALLYLSFQNDGHALIAALLIPIALLLVIVAIVDKRVHASFPEWVDPVLHKGLYKKQASHYINKVGHVMCVIVRHSFALYCNWDQFERHLDSIVQSAQQRDIDIVVGVKTGGAIMSKYIAEKLGIPFYYIKTSADVWKCNKKAINTYQDVAERVLLNKKRHYVICEPIKANLQGKNILLLDELVYSGVTLQTVRDYLLNEKGARDVKVAVVTLYKPDELLTRDLDMFVATPNKYTVWPWGFDN